MRIPVLLAITTLVACGGKESNAASGATSDAPNDAGAGSACVIPPGLLSPDSGTARGSCRASATPFTINGTNACDKGTYSVSCVGDGASQLSASCTVIPIPTPTNTTIYCCPCGD